MRQDQAPLPVIQELLGHSNIATTQLYLKISDAQVRHYAELAALGAAALSPPDAPGARGKARRA